MEPSPLPVLGRREANRESRREAILDVAQRSFLKQGYASTTMSGIAARLGGSKGTLWNYFPSKEALFAAMVDRATDQFRRQLMVILDPNSDFERALQRFCEQFLTKLTSDEGIALHRLVIGEAHRFPELGRIFYERGPRQTQHLLADFIANAQACGYLGETEPTRAAQHLIWLCMSGSYQLRVTGIIAAVSPKAIAEDVHAAMTTFLRAYATGRLA